MNPPQVYMCSTATDTLPTHIEFSFTKIYNFKMLPLLYKEQS